MKLLLRKTKHEKTMIALAIIGISQVCSGMEQIEELYQLSAKRYAQICDPANVRQRFLPLPDLRLMIVTLKAAQAPPSITMKTIDSNSDFFTKVLVASEQK